MRYSTDVQKLIKVMEELRKIDKLMPAQVAQTLFLVANHPGINFAELEEATGLANSSCSRNVAALSDWHRFGKPGLGLVEAVPDPKEGRRKVLFLTPKGNKFMAKIVSLLRPDDPITDFGAPTAKEHATATFLRHKAAG